MLAPFFWLTALLNLLYMTGPRVDGWQQMLFQISKYNARTEILSMRTTKYQSQ